MGCEKCQSSNTTRIGCCNFDLCTKHIQNHYSNKYVCEYMILYDWIDKNKLEFPDLFKIQKKLTDNEIKALEELISDKNIIFLMPKKEYLMFQYGDNELDNYLEDPQGFFKNHILLINTKKDIKFVKKVVKMFTIDSGENQYLSHSLKNLDGINFQINYDQKENFLKIESTKNKERAIIKYYPLQNGYVFRINRPLQ